MTNSGLLKKVLWQQFGAAIDMLENAIKACPNDLWAENNFWHLSYHTVFFLDFYSCPDSSTYKAPLPFDNSELNPEGIMPERIYDKSEVLQFLDYARQKNKALLMQATQQSLYEVWDKNNKDYSLIEILMYNMRHVQHHAAQLNLLLRQSEADVPGWVSRTDAL